MAHRTHISYLWPLRQLKQSDQWLCWTIDPTRLATLAGIIISYRSQEMFGETIERIINIGS